MTINLGIDSYSQHYIKEMDAFYPYLWKHLDIIPSFPSELSAKVISYLLKIGCQSTHIGNIRLGKESLISMPRDWLIERIHDIATQTLDLNDDWEYTRLLEIYTLLDKDLLVLLCQLGKQSGNVAIQEAANDFME